MKDKLVPAATVRDRLTSTPAVPSLVSVIVPCYNYGRFLPDNLGSVLSQEGVDVEVIVVDDASADDSAEVAARFAQADPRVKLIRHERNTGHVVAYNDGFAIASGDYIVRLDADDLLTPGSLARAVALFEAFPNVGLVYGRPRHFSTAIPTPTLSPIKHWTIWRGADWLEERTRRGVNCITTPEAMIRASTHHLVGGLRTELRYAQDLEMWLRVASVSDVGRIAGVDQALHRDHPVSMSATAGSEIITDLGERRTVFKLLFETPPGAQMLNSSTLLATAQKTLGREALDTACRAYERGRVATAPIAQLIEFAVATWPGAEQSAEWRRLKRRRSVGPRMSKYAPPFFARALRRRLGEEFAYYRWQRTGI